MPQMQGRECFDFDPMAVGLAVCFFLVSVNSCFGSNNTTLYLAPSSTTLLTSLQETSVTQLKPSSSAQASSLAQGSSLTQSSFLTQPTSLAQRTSFAQQTSLAQHNVVNITRATTVQPTSSTTLLSTNFSRHLSLQTVSPSSFAPTLSSRTRLDNTRGTFVKKSSSLLPTGTLGPFTSIVSTSTSALLSASSRSRGSIPVPSSSPQYRLYNNTRSITGSSDSLNASFVASLATRTSFSGQGSSPSRYSSTTAVTQGPTKSRKSRESLLSGQLAGIALILFILVVLLLIICLGNFADQPSFNQRELFNEETNMENLGTDRYDRGAEDEEWKFDPLFAWSPRKSYDSKL